MFLVKWFQTKNKPSVTRLRVVLRLKRLQESMEGTYSKFSIFSRLFRKIFWDPISLFYFQTNDQRLIIWTKLPWNPVWQFLYQRVKLRIIISCSLRGGESIDESGYLEVFQSCVVCHQVETVLLSHEKKIHKALIGLIIPCLSKKVVRPAFLRLLTLRVNVDGKCGCHRNFNFEICFYCSRHLKQKSWFFSRPILQLQGWENFSFRQHFRNGFGLAVSVMDIGVVDNESIFGGTTFLYSYDFSETFQKFEYCKQEFSEPRWHTNLAELLLADTLREKQELQFFQGHFLCYRRKLSLSKEELSKPSIICQRFLVGIINRWRSERPIIDEKPGTTVSVSNPQSSFRKKTSYIERRVQ